jgi:hypothetical protein
MGAARAAKASGREREKKLEYLQGKMDAPLDHDLIAVRCLLRLLSSFHGLVGESTVLGIC